MVGQEGMAGARCGRSSVSKEGQMANKGGDGRVQEGQMAVFVCGWGIRGDGREPDGVGGSGGKEGQMAGEGGDGRVQEGQMAVSVGWWDRRGDGKEPYGAGAVEARRARWLEREGMAGCRRARWQLLGQWGGRRVGRVGVQDGDSQ